MTSQTISRTLQLLLAIHLADECGLKNFAAALREMLRKEIEQSGPFLNHHG